MAKRKKGMTFIPYDYEAAYNKSLEDMNEFFVEQMFKHGKKVVYALKEIRAGDQFEVEIYPQFKKMDEVPPEGRSIKKDNDKAQRNLNDKNARKYVERLINENFTDRDLWLTFTYDNEHLPPDGDIDAAIKNVQKFIRRVNYQRKKRGLPNARYVYVTAYNPTEEIRWHHHIVIPANGYLMQTDMKLLLKQEANQVTRLRDALEEISEAYDYCICDCGRLLDMVVINILLAAELVIAPVKVGGYENEAIHNLQEQVDDLREINPELRIKGLVTMRQKNKTSLDFEEWMKTSSGFDMFVTPIRRSIVAEKASMRMAVLPQFSKNCIVSQDYRNVVHELLKEMEGET